jgi:hypothetical protein
MKLVTGIVASLVIGSLSFGVMRQRIEKDKSRDESDESRDITTSDTSHRWTRKRSVEKSG